MFVNTLEGRVRKSNKGLMDVVALNPRRTFMKDGSVDGDWKVVKMEVEEASYSFDWSTGQDFQTLREA